MEKVRLCFFLLLVFFLTGCGSCRCTNTNGIDSLGALQNLSQGCANGGNTNAIRSTALQEIALSTGAQAGLAARTKQINLQLQQNYKTLDIAFNFNLMMLVHNVLPPVLEQSNANLNLGDDNTLRIADRSYRIVSQARFVTTPPNWRDYLWMSYSPPDRPDNSLLPKNSDERQIWKQYTAIGWQKGVDQAETIYAANLSRLKRDFMGMILYRKLLAQHMVSAPFVAKSDLGVTGDMNQITINDQILRITALPQLQPNAKIWRPVITP